MNQSAWSRSGPGSALGAIKQIEYFARALQAPRIRDSAARLADQTRDSLSYYNQSIVVSIANSPLVHSIARGLVLRATGVKVTLPSLIYGGFVVQVSEH